MLWESEGQAWQRVWSRRSDRVNARSAGGDSATHGCSYLFVSKFQNLSSNHCGQGRAIKQQKIMPSACKEGGAAQRRPHEVIRIPLCGLATALLFLVAAAGVPTAEGTVPAAPTNLNVPYVTRFELAVAWVPPVGATMYKLEYRESNTGPPSAYTSYGPGATFDETLMLLGDLQEGTNYDLRVYAGNADGWSPAAALEGNVNTKTTNPPDPPLGVKQSAFTETSMSLTWTDAAGPTATHWRVKVSECEKRIWQAECVDGRPCLTDRTVRCGDYEYYKENESIVEFTSKPALIKNLRSGYTYFMVVEARNHNVNGYDYGGSLPVTLTPRGAYDSAPTNLRVNGVQHNAVLLSWDAAPGATHYRIQFRVPAESASWFPTSNQAQLLTTASEYAVVELMQDKTYEFRVLARDLFEQTVGGGQLSWAGDVQGYEEDQFASNIVSATPVQQLKDNPTGLTVMGVRDTEVHLTWNALARADYYVLQYKKFDEAYEMLEYWMDVESKVGEARRFTSTSGQVTELTTNRRYEFRLKAFNTHVGTATYLGYSGPSAVVYGVPLPRLGASQDFALVATPWLDMLECASNTCALQAGSKVSVYLSPDAPNDDGLLVGALLRITSGTARYQNSRILSYNATSKEARLAVPFDTAASVGDRYEVSRYAVGEERATLVWTHFPGATKYKILIRRSGAHQGYAEKVVLTEPLAHTGACTRTLPKNGSSHPALTHEATRCYEVTGLVQGVRYDLILSAGNLHLEWGVYSEAVHVTAVSLPKQTPGTPIVLSQTAESVTFKWSTPTSDTAPTANYRVMQRQVMPDESATLWSTPKNYGLLTDSEPGFQVTGLQRGYAYDFEIVSGNLAGFRYPALSFRLVTPCTQVEIDAVSSVTDCARARTTQAQCKYMTLKLSWSPAQYGLYFKVLARKRGSTHKFIGLPAVAAAPYLSKATIIGPNVSTFAFDNAHYPELRDYVEFEYKVVSSFTAQGPFEGVGSQVTVGMQTSVPLPVKTLRLKSKTLRSITVTWQHALAHPIHDHDENPPYYYVARVCASGAGDCGGMSVYPKHENLSQATRFVQMEATLDLSAGALLQPDVPYNITIYACNYFDGNLDGELTGDEGCNTLGVQLPYAVMPGGMAQQVTTLKVTQTHASVLRLEWQRAGVLGAAATMYDIEQRKMGSSEWSKATRMLVRGIIANCVHDTSRCARCDPSKTALLYDQCVQAVGVTYGLSEAVDTCGNDTCVENFGDAHLYMSEGEMKGQIRPLLATPPSVPSNVFILNTTLFGNRVQDTFETRFTKGTYNVYKKAVLGGVCCPITSQTIVAYIADLEADTAYQFRVYAGNMNEQHFETLGSHIATAFTVSQPNAVDDLTFLYLVGHNATRVEWSDPGGGQFCGERMYQIVGRLGLGDEWEVLNLTAPNAPWIKHIESNDGVGRVQLTVMGLPWARTSHNLVTYPAAVLENMFMVRTYCSNHLGLPHSSIPHMTYLDDISYSRVDGKSINITLKPPPSATVQGLQVLYVTGDSVFMRWDALPRAEMYKVIMSYDDTVIAGPWKQQFQAFSAWTDWPNANSTQIFRTREAKVTGLTAGLRYRFKIAAGTRHAKLLGTFSAESLPTRLAYTLAAPPSAVDILLHVYKITATRIKVRFGVASQMSVDPSNHSRPLVVLLLQKGNMDFEGGVNASGCSNVVVADETFIGPPPACRELTVLNYTSDGRTIYEYEFANLQEGLNHHVKVKTWNLHTPNHRRIVYSGKATSCICATYATKYQCSEYRMLGTSLSCSVSAQLAYLQAPASSNTGAYNMLYAFVRQGTGAGQRRRIAGYQGARRALLFDSPLDILLDETSLVEIHEAGLASEGSLAASCAPAQTVCSTVFLNAANSTDAETAYVNGFMELVGGVCDKQMRRVVAYRGATRQVVVYPAFTCNPAVGQLYEIRSFSFAEKTIGPIAQRGPPDQPSIPLTGVILHNSVALSWDVVTRCISSTGYALQCQVESYRIRTKKTHDSSDFPVVNSTWMEGYFYSASHVTVLLGLEDMCSFELQVSAKTALNDEWGAWSVSQYVKLTGGAPSLQPILLPFLAGLYNNKIKIRWTTDLNPKQMDRFFLRFGESENSMRDFGSIVGGAFKRTVFMDFNVCTQDTPSKSRCEALLTGLEMGTIYVVQVFGGNTNGFEEIGTSKGTQATLLLPVTPVSHLKLLQVIMSGNVSGYGAMISWNRPQSYPSVTKYYVASSENYGAFARLYPAIESTQRTVQHTVGYLNKGSVYRLRVHSGNHQGPTGFHAHMPDDPTASIIITVVPDDVPGRVEIGQVTAIVPDMNSMAVVTWSVPNAGADATYFTIGTKLINNLQGCETCDTTRLPNTGYCLPNKEPKAIRDESTGTWRYRKCNFNPPCDATCAPALGVMLYTGCLATHANCITNPACHAIMGQCFTPCQGASNEGPMSAGQTCVFTGTKAEVTGLVRDAWYEFYAFSGNTAGIGLASDPFWHKTAALAVPVTGLIISEVRVDRVVLVWNPMLPHLCTGGGNGKCTYRVTWDPATAEGSEGNTTRQIGPMGAVYYQNSFEHKVDFSSGSRRYMYRVFAGDDRTNLFEQFGTAITMPAAATEFKVVAASQNSLTFSWTPDVSANSYQIFMSSGLAYRPASAPTAALSIRVEGLSQGLPYNFKVFSKVMGRTPLEYGGSVPYRAVPAGLSSAPKELSVVSATHSTVELQWEAGDATGAVRYQIVRSIDGHPYMAYPQHVEMLLGASHHALITDLLPSSLYKFKVYAGSFNGFENVGSNVVDQVQPVGRARSLSIRGVSDSSVTIDWLPPAYGLTPSHYQVEYRIGDVKTRIADVEHLGGSRATQSALLTPLDRNEYAVRVFCKSQSGFYEPSGTGDAKAVPLLVPYGLRVIYTSVDSVTLAWQMPKYTGTGYQPQSYKIDYIMTSQGTTGLVDNIPIYHNTTQITGLETNRPYTFSIQAEFEAGLYFGTLSSNVVEATPLDQPSNLTITGVSATQVSLQWIAPGVGILPIAYRLRYIEMRSGLLKDVNGVPHAGSFKAQQQGVVTGLTNGMQYGFLVLAQAGTGAYSDNDMTPITTSPMTMPQDLRITQVTLSTAKAEWLPPQPTPGGVNPVNYELHYANKVQTIPFGNSEWVVSELGGAISYTFCLFVRSPAGDLIPGNGGCRTVITVNQVTNLRIIDSTHSSLTLAWDAVTGVTTKVAYMLVAVPIKQGVSVMSGEASWLPLTGRSKMSVLVPHLGHQVHNVSLTNLSHGHMFEMRIYVVVEGRYTEPVGSNALQVSPVGRATRTRLCYYDKTEIAIQWTKPETGPVPSQYRISYRKDGCRQQTWQVCATTVTTPSIQKQGHADAVQTYTLFGLDEGTVYDFRVHAYNDDTRLFDQVGSVALKAQARGDRSDFALRLPRSANGYVEVSKSSDHLARKHFETRSVTLEAWVKVDGVAAATVGYQGIAGNLYSFSTQSMASQGAGHFGYGLVCQTKVDGGTYCGMRLGMLTDGTMRTSLQGLCTSLSFENPTFCGGMPGWTKGEGAESLSEVALDQWIHLAASYNHTNGHYILMVNGQMHMNRTLAYTKPDGDTAHPEIYYTGNDGAYPASVTFPRNRMDWNIGRGLIGDIAPTVATAPYSYFAGSIDQVRVWSYGKTGEEMRRTAYLDTVAPHTAGLLGYWPFDDASFHQTCADQVSIVRDARAGNVTYAARLHGAAQMTLSTMPLDREAVFSGLTPANNSQFVVHLGDSIRVEVEAGDGNPSDKAVVVLQVPASQYAHPTAAVFSDVSRVGGELRWSPVARDAGKHVAFCFRLSNSVTNPLRPSFALQSTRQTRCLQVHVPLCIYKATSGETVRSIARSFHTNWRTLFMLNPEIGHPNQVAAGRTVRIGSLYTIGPHENLTSVASSARVSWTSFANNNGAIVNRLWTDEYFEAQASYARMSRAIQAFDPGHGVFDVAYPDLDMLHAYNGQQVCLVAQLNTNCI